MVGAAAAAGATYILMPKPAPPEKIELRVLLESAPESKGIEEASFPLYESENPNIVFSWDTVPREVFPEKYTRELTELKGRYDMMITHATAVPVALRTKGWVFGLEKMGVVDEEEARTLYREELIKDCKHPETGEFIQWPPLYWNTMGLYYRKDMFEDPAEKDAFKDKYGYDLRVPGTWDELFDVAEFFTRPPDLYGFWLDGIDWAHYHVWACFMLSQGVWFVDEKGVHPDWLSDKNVKALEFCKTMSQFCPPGWEAEDFFTGERLLKEGKLAMHLNWQYCYADFFNPEKVSAPVLGNVEQAFLPVAPDTGYYKSFLSSMKMAIFSASRRIEESAKFLAWLDTFDAAKALAMTGYFYMPARADVQKDPEVQEKLQLYPDKWLNFDKMKLHPWGPEPWLRIGTLLYAPSAEIYLKYIHGEVPDALTALEMIKAEMERLLG